MSLLLGRDLFFLSGLSAGGFLCLELDLRQRFECEETRWLAVVSTESVGQVVF